MSAHSRYRCARVSLLLGPIALIGAGGCGAGLGEPTALQPFFLTECDKPIAPGHVQINAVMLDWTGGISPIYPDDFFDGIDLDRFELADGGTLAERSAEFKEDVRRRIARIYCELGKFDVRVTNGEYEDAAADTSVVHVTQAIPPKGGTDVGEGEYDPCNEQRDNAAILFGERLLSLSENYTYDEWVNVVTNICAHEIGHMLGFGHIPREERTDVGRSVFVELMLSGHTMAELKRTQRFLTDQDTCPDADAVTAKIAESADTSWAHGDNVVELHP